jgi:AbrB family looped-hinge helix DNA binding protein
MKATGITRKVDELGRIVLPVELRRTMEIDEGDALEIYVESDSIILKKYGQKKADIMGLEKEFYAWLNNHHGVTNNSMGMLLFLEDTGRLKG